MPKRTPFNLVEESGDRSPTLTAAQEIALPGLAADLAATIQGLLLAGVLTRQEGRIIPPQERIFDA